LWFANQVYEYAVLIVLGLLLVLTDVFMTIVSFTDPGIVPEIVR